MMKEDIPVVLYALFGALMGVWVVVASIAHATTDSRCLAAGWREGKVSWSFERYCVTRNDQTDVVRPLAFAEANPQFGGEK